MCAVSQHPPWCVYMCVCVCVGAQSISTRHGVCVFGVCVRVQSVSTRHGVFVLCCVKCWLAAFFRFALLPSLQHDAFLHCQAGSVEAWHARQFHRLISSFLCKTGG